jgi:predicted enzyme related to lactoylglutathione lyase
MPTKTKARTGVKNKHEEKLGNPVVWVEFPTSDYERAKRFYAAVFGFKYQDVENLGYRLALFQGGQMDSYGTSGALIYGEGYTPSHDGALTYFHAPDMKETEKKIQQNGGKVFKPKFSIGQWGYIAICEDSEGNRIGLHSMD